MGDNVGKTGEVSQTPGVSSYNDYKTQETKGIGKSTNEQELTKNPLEKTIEELSSVSKISSVIIDANAEAIKSDTSGLPE